MNSNLYSLPDPIELLSRNAEVTPTWLRRFKANAPFPRREFFSSRVVFYPAAGDDFHPLRLFGPSNAAHCFVMADYMLKEDMVRHFLEFPQLSGYSCVSLQSLPLEAFWKEQKWTRHFFPNAQELETIERTQSFSQGQSFALFAVYDSPNRLAVLYLGHEAVEVYDRLFCQVGSAKNPFAILIQNHGMGGDFNQMATPHSYLNQLANAFGRPKWIVAEDGNCVWFGYEPVSAISHGGMHGLPRRLFRDKFPAVKN